MEVMPQLLMNGLSLGSIYALVAVGFTLIFGVVQMINFAHADFYMVGAFALYILYKLAGLPYLIAAILAIAVLGLAGYSMRRVLKLSPDTPFETMILLTLGVSITLQNGALAIFGNTSRSVATSSANAILSIGPATISHQRVIIIGLSVISFLLLDHILRRTRTGKAMRAVAQNLEAATVVGIDSQLISSITFVVGVGLAGLAGAFVAPAFFILPTMGILLIAKCFAVAIMGGRGNVRGAFVSAYALGTVESVGIFFIGAGFRDVFAFVLLIGVLLARPEGLFGQRVNLI